MNQFRPRGSDGPFYSPHRDIAYCFVPAMQEVLTHLVYSKLVTEDEKGEDYSEALAQAIKQVSEASELFLSKEVTTPYEALEKVGFWEIPNKVRRTLFARLGEVMLGGFFHAVREVTYEGSPPPEECQLERLAVLGRVLAEQIHGKSKEMPEVVDLQIAVDAREQRIYCLRRQLEDAKRDVAMWQAKATMAERAKRHGGFLKQLWRRFTRRRSR